METEKSMSENEKPKAKIQSFEPKYQESTEDCIREVRRTQYNDPKADVKPRYKNIHENCQRFPNEDFLIAIDEPTDKVVGTVGLRFIKDGVGKLIRLSVRPGFEGQGIGSRLINELMAFAKANQYKEVYLSTETDDEPQRRVECTKGEILGKSSPATCQKTLWICYWMATTILQKLRKARQ